MTWTGARTMDKRQSRNRDRFAEAVSAHRAGRLEAAAAGYRAILKHRPDHADALHLLGLVRHQGGDNQGARPLIERALRLAPDSAAYANSLGLVLFGLGRLGEAEAAFLRALSAEPKLAEAHNNLGNARALGDDPAGAAAAYAEAIAARPGYAVAHANRAGALRRLGDLPGAESAVLRALALRPDYAGASCTLGLIRHEQGDYDGALAAYDRALALEPELAEARANRAVLLLLLGRLGEGWREYEWRWRVAGFTTPKRAFPAPAWDGEPLAGRTILIHAEQGLGSAIQFVRYVPMVTARGGRVVLECQPPLVRLFSSLAQEPGSGPITLIAKGEPLPDFETHAPLMSLPRLFATTLETIPNAVPYLTAAPRSRTLWRGRLAALARPRVGVVWAGNPKHHNDRNRSMPASALAPLLSMTGISFVDLQVGAAAHQRVDLPADAAAALRPPDGELAEFADTAAIVAELDLVLSVDTAVAHLAGALAKPVWLLVPFVPEWRWLRERTDSPWYPTMRLFRQTSPGDWSGVLSAVSRALREAFP